MSTATSLDRIRTGPILPTLLRLSTPNVLAMSLAVLVAIAETFYVGLLGTTPLAALGLVFPFAMLTGTLSAGAMGGGVSSAIARAIGAADMARAPVLAMPAGRPHCWRPCPALPSASPGCAPPAAQASARYRAPRSNPRA